MDYSSSVLNSDRGRRPVGIFLLIENRILRESLACSIRKRRDLRVVGESQYSESAIKQIVESHCNVLLLDHSSVLAFPQDLIPHIVSRSPRTAIILFGMERDPASFLKAVQSGVVGYLLKDASTADIIAGVRGVAQGEAVCPPRLCLALFQHVARESRVTATMPNHRLRRELGLTKRQQQLVSLVAMGLTNKEIAAQLNLSEFTIKNHIHRLLKQFDVESRHDAIENIRASGYAFATTPRDATLT